MPTIKEIIDNQSQFKDEITSFLKNDMSLALKTLREIKTDDKAVKADLEKFKKRVKSMKAPSVSDLFYMSKKRNPKYYAWWDAETEEATINSYAENP